MNAQARIDAALSEALVVQTANAIAYQLLAGTALHGAGGKDRETLVEQLRDAAGLLQRLASELDGKDKKPC